MITEAQKNIYNWYLRAQRVHNNKPFRYRKNFDNLDKETFYPHLLKIERVFQKYPHLMRREFFDAPYIIYNDVKKFYGLNFFSSLKGLTTCIAYFKLLAQQQPDEQIDFLKESLRFVTNFCAEHDLMLNQYIRFKSIAQNDCLKHLKNHQISWYLVMAIPGFINLVQSLPRDEFSLYFGEDIDLNFLISAYGSSKLAKVFLEKKIREIDEFLIKKKDKIPS